MDDKKAIKVRKLNRLQFLNLESDVCGYIIAGLSRSEILEHIITEYPQLTDRNASDLYDAARNSIVDRVGVNLESVVDLHIRWYEEIWKAFDTLDHVPGKNASLRQKEKILGLLKEENIIKIDNQVNVSVNKEVKYDTSKLTPEEQRRLNGYLKLVAGG